MTPNNLDQFSPVKWEEFESVARPYSGMTVRSFALMCVLASVFGALWAFNH